MSESVFETDYRRNQIIIFFVKRERIVLENDTMPI